MNNFYNNINNILLIINSYGLINYNKLNYILINIKIDLHNMIKKKILNIQGHGYKLKIYIIKENYI